MSRLERRHGAYPGEGTEETRVEREREGEEKEGGRERKPRQGRMTSGGRTRLTSTLNPEA